MEYAIIDERGHSFSNVYVRASHDMGQGCADGYWKGEWCRADVYLNGKLMYNGVTELVTIHAGIEFDFYCDWYYLESNII